MYFSFIDSISLLIFSTPEFRNAFLKTIRQIIRDSVRRMNLPPVNPSPNEATSSSTAQLNYNQNRNTGNNNGMIKRGNLNGNLLKSLRAIIRSMCLELQFSRP